jgi:hypothetical protein
MSYSPAENIVFMVIRGLVALAIVGVAFYCIGQGIHFFTLPHSEAEAIEVHVLGLNMSATGLGAVIFGTGIALCFVGLRAAPKKFETRRTLDGGLPPGPPAGPPPEVGERAIKPPAPGFVAIPSQEVPSWTPTRLIDETVVTKVISPSDNPGTSTRDYY